MKKQINPTIKAHLIRSAIYFLSLLAVLGIPFALAQSRSGGTTRPSVDKPGVAAGTSPLSTAASIPTFVGVALPAQRHAIAPKGSNKNVEGDYVIDLAALDIHPTQVPLPLRVALGAAGSPEGAAMGTGKAFMGITHEVVNHSTSNAFGTLSSGWTASESVQIFVNGSLAATLA